MPVILTAIVETLLYLLSIPLCAAFTLTTAGGVRCGVGVSAFDPRQALRRARGPAAKQAPRRKSGAKPPWRASRRRAGRASASGAGWAWATPPPRPWPAGRCGGWPPPSVPMRGGWRWT